MCTHLNELFRIGELHIMKPSQWQCLAPVGIYAVSIITNLKANGKRWYNVKLYVSSELPLIKTSESYNFYIFSAMLLSTSFSTSLWSG